MSEFEQLQHIKVPEERLSVRQNALQSALSEFDKLQEKKQKSYWRFFKEKWIGIRDTLQIPPRAFGALASVLLVVIASSIYFVIPELNEPHKEQYREHDIASEKAEKINTPQPAVKQGRSYKGPNATSVEKHKRTKPLRIKRFNDNIGNSGTDIRSQTPTVHLNEQNDRERVATEKKILNPKQGNLPVHYCLQKNTQCGKKVADIFCKSQGYDKATSAPESKNKPKKTISIRDTETYELSGEIVPRTFAYIICTH